MVTSHMMILDNTIQCYAWGSRTAIADLLGLPSPSAEPQAELWMGAHPLAPSEVILEGRRERLDAAIAREPDRLLGGEVRSRFGDKLPFLLKVLAAAEPLSLQAHPSIEIAERGFEEEEREGIPRNAPTRNYKDRNHKPELLAALTPFDALYGFRAPEQTVEFLRRLRVPELEWAVEVLEKSPDHRGLRRAFERILAPGWDREPMVRATIKACDGYEGSFEETARWVSKMAKLHPDDPGLVTVLLLNLLRLEPGDALYLPAGNLHAYLGGVGIEIMASSDNVLRGGLTKKHVDLKELLRVLDFSPVAPAALRPKAVGAEQVYETRAPEFRLSRIAATATPAQLISPGPEIWLLTEGDAHLDAGGEGVRLRRGQSVFVPATAGSIRIAGRGTLFRATVNGPSPK